MPARHRIAVLLATVLVAARLASAEDRPNILWITSEDNGPHLGCYGDTFADTPNIDALAARGVIYSTCWSTVPVCAPARTAIITGMYPSSLGAEHMRSMVRLPAGVRMFPQYLRDAGYYCTNRSKEDYNVAKPGTVWDQSGGKAHWRNRAEGQPFFAVINFTQSHESRIRTRPHEAVHDPAAVRVPRHHPDTPEVRADWAQYYDKMTHVDRQVGRVLADLEADGLSDDTIVFYYADHGSGMPRHKRSPRQSGLQVPLVVHVPDRFRHLAPDGYAPGAILDRLVGFVDLAPTVLSLVGLDVPEVMQGLAFMGPRITPDPDFLYGGRGRMDERYELQRSVTDGRYVYVRNYLLTRPYGQHVAYMFQTPTTAVWKAMFDEGVLPPEQAAFWECKPPEVLFDIEVDPDEVVDLAGRAEHRETVERLREAHLRHVRAIRDVGILPEPEMLAAAGAGSPYALGREMAGDLDAVLATAEIAADRTPHATARLERSLESPNASIRYWAVMGLLNRGADAVVTALEPLRSVLRDGSPSPRIAAAEALGLHGTPDDLAAALEVLLADADVGVTNVYVAMAALNAIDALGPRAAPLRERIARLPRTDPAVHGRLKNNLPKLLDRILSNLDAPAPPADE
ncbi:MAG: sulfatase-like hydrolase/transferase [Planctomycetota bacterium]|jgi:uncharacterized sulfatase